MGCDIPDTVVGAAACERQPSRQDPLQWSSGQRPAFRKGFLDSIRLLALDRSDWVEDKEKDVAAEGCGSKSVEMGRRQPPVDLQRADSADGVNLGEIAAVPSLNCAEAIAGQQGLAVPEVGVSRETHRC